MKFTFEGDHYDFDLGGKLTVAEAMLIHDKAHIGMSEWLGELSKGNPYAVASLIYIVKRRAGEALRFDDLLSMDLMSFEVIRDEQAEPEAAVASAPDPTSRSGKTRRSAASPS
ncbi:MAG: hypothetical protein ACRDRN_24840 [Sciscionella sp.]